MLRYYKGQFYLAHHDFFDPAAYRNGAMFDNINAGHLNRLLTVFWYMSDVEGGYTVCVLWACVCSGRAFWGACCA